MSPGDLRPPPTSPTPAAGRSRLHRAAVGLALAAGLSLALAACSSGAGGSSITTVTKPTISTPSTTGAPSTTNARPSTTSTSAAPTTTANQVTTTTSGSTTTTGGSTTTSSGPTTSTSTSPSTSTTTTSPSTTSTTRPPSTTTTTTAAPTTTTATSPVSQEVGPESKKVPWLAIGLLAALVALVAVVVVRRRAERKTWWSDLDAMGRQGQALVDLGTAGPASADVAQQVAHWATLEQHTTELAAAVAAAGPGAPDDPSRAVLTGLDQSVTAYLTALRTSRTLRIGPPAPTAEQLQFADAESAQRLANLRGALGQLDQLVAPHR